MTSTFETSNPKEAIAYRFSLQEALIGNRAFYRRVATVVIPMIIQNTLSNIVGLLDNIMVGQVGTLPMSAVAIVNQILFIFYLCIWGSLAGAGIFSTQFFGKGDMDGVRYSIRFKLMTAITICTVAILLLFFAKDPLISLYIAADTPSAERIATLGYGVAYLNIMLIGLIPFSITQVYASAMRESGKTTLPMAAGMIAMVVNFIFNALLIFGLLGLPKMGVLGAAVATVISRFTELAIVAIGAHRTNSAYGFFHGVFKSLYVPGTLVKPIILKTLPLLCNEFLWSLAQATLLQSYSIRGIAVIAAMNISGTISQIFNEVFLSLGNSAGIIVGQELGADHLVNARRSAWRMAALSVASTLVMGAALALLAPFIPRIYNTEPQIRDMATHFIWVLALVMPINSFANVSYFIMRSGGKTAITFIFDSCFAWIVSVPAAYLLTHYTALPVLTIYLIISLMEFLKCVMGFFFLRSGIWVRNIVSHTAEA